MSEYISSDVLAEEAKKLYSELKDKIDNNSLTTKDRMTIHQQEMPTGEPLARARSMGEVATGYTVEQAIVEANRCLQCKNVYLHYCSTRLRAGQMICHIFCAGTVFSDFK